MGLEFRNAERKDTTLILHFIRELADYEKCLMKWLQMQSRWKNGFLISRKRK